MHIISDQELLDELNKRFIENKKALKDIQVMSQKLTDLNLQLITSEKMKSNFLSNIRNEFNNPLASIQGISEILIDDDVNKEQRIELATAMNKEVFSLTFQMTNIFLAAELEAGDVRMTRSLINVRHILKSTMNSFAKLSQTKNIVIDLNCKVETSHLCDQYTDPEKFQLIISNLVSNAIKFGNEDTTVTITLYRTEQHFIIEVKNHGVPIEKKNYKTIFNRFSQVDSGTLKQHCGHGLGLSITKELVELIGGTITVKSCEQEKSTTFITTIPIIDHVANTTPFSEESNEFMFDENFTFDEDDGVSF